MATHERFQNFQKKYRNKSLKKTALEKLVVYSLLQLLLTKAYMYLIRTKLHRKARLHKHKCYLGRYASKNAKKCEYFDARITRGSDKRLPWERGDANVASF